LTKLEAAREKKLASLPAQFGFSTAEEFAQAVVKAAGQHKGRPTAIRRRRRKGKRAVVTDATRAHVKELVKAGKTGTAIAAELKISLPTVGNIKKALGLTKARK
jgi:hypothetical protein